MWHVHLVGTDVVAIAASPRSRSDDFFDKFLLTVLVRGFPLVARTIPQRGRGWNKVGRLRSCNEVKWGKEHMNQEKELRWMVWLPIRGVFGMRAVGVG